MKKILFILLFFPLGVWAQTSTENYILTKTYKVPSTQVITDTDPTQTSTSIETEISKSFTLNQNYPNPFNSSTIKWIWIILI